MYEGAVAAGYELTIGSTTDFCVGALAPHLSETDKLCVTQVGRPAALSTHTHTHTHTHTRFSLYWHSIYNYYRYHDYI